MQPDELRRKIVFEHKGWNLLGFDPSEGLASALLE